MKYARIFHDMYCANNHIMESLKLFNIKYIFAEVRIRLIK